MYRLNGATGDKSGLGVALKVMTGDVIDIYAKSFWHSNGSNPNNSYSLTSALTSFIGTFAGTSAVAGSAVHGATATALANSSGQTYTGLNSWLGSVPNPSSSTVPKAYINWILFDEQFRPISSSSGYDLVNTSPDAVKSHHSVVTVPKGGYLYVYCSNESNIDVFFDNLQLIDTRGPLLETDNYYPFGLTMAGISSKAAGKLTNRLKYNGKEEQRQEFSDGSGLEWLDFGARMQDRQLGRWMVNDPESDKYFNTSPLAYVANNPINLIDPDGRIIRDAKGNIAFIPVSEMNLPFANGQHKVMAGYIFTNDGTRILAYQNMSDDKGVDTDCHGTSFGDGNFWIDNSQIPSLLKGDGYKEVSGEKEVKINDFIIYENSKNEVQDSRRIVQVDKNGILVYGQGGLDIKNSTKLIDKAWAFPGTLKRFFRKVNKDLVQSASVIASLKNGLSKETIIQDMNKSSKLAEKKAEKEKSNAFFEKTLNEQRNERQSILAN